MSPTNAEICFKCGRLLLSSEQAYVVGGKIVCAECDKLLRSEQVLQPALSPDPLPETRKDTKKDASLRNCVLAAIGIIIVAVVLWNMFFSAPKYQVEEKIKNTKYDHYLSVTVAGPADDIAVMLISPSGKCLKETIEKINMSIGPATVDFDLVFQLGSESPLVIWPDKIEQKTIKWRLVVKRIKNLKTIYEKEITFIGTSYHISIANPEGKESLETPTGLGIN